MSGADQQHTKKKFGKVSEIKILKLKTNLGEGGRLSSVLGRINLIEYEGFGLLVSSAHSKLCHTLDSITKNINLT